MYKYISDIFKLTFIINCFFLFIYTVSDAQNESNEELSQLGGDGYREGQYPGLGRAASGIFYSEKKVTFSGYAELANVFNGGEIRDASSGDLELYYSQLYRITPYIGVRLSKNLFWTTELGIEYLEGNNESDFHFFPETYLDYIFKSELSFRIGIQPLNIGYINNNEEPVLFLSVNRPETERLVLPTEWIELGFTAYGSFKDKLNYSLTVSNGVLAKNFQEPTWIRGGADGQLESFNKLAINTQLSYLPIPSLTLSLSNYYNQTGRDETVDVNNVTTKVSAPINLFSGYARWDNKGFSIIGMGVSGKLNETYELYYLTEEHQESGQVIGEKTFGYYLEPSFDILKLFSTSSKDIKEGSIFTIHDAMLPIFIRYERLDTHSSIDPRLLNNSINRSNLKIWMVGMNYKPNHNVAVKFNVRFRENLTPTEDAPNQETLYELGIGIEF